VSLGAGWGTAEPQHDGRGEIIDAEVIDEPELNSTGMEVELADKLAWDGFYAVQLFRDPEAVAHLSRDATRMLLERVRALAADAAKRRADGKPSSSTLAPEITLMADAYDTLRAVERVFSAGAVEAREISGELARELADDTRKSSSVRVGDAHGTDVKLSRTVQTEMRVDVPEIVDVIVASLIAAEARAPHGDVELTREDTLRAYANGARDAIETYRRIAAAHSFKSTTLDAFVRDLEGSGDDALAIRLGHAYGRVSKGETVKLERVERKT
jgi:hypothetical protein